MKHITIEAREADGIILDQNKLQEKLGQITGSLDARGKIYPSLFKTGRPGALPKGMAGQKNGS